MSKRKRRSAAAGEKAKPSVATAGVPARWAYPWLFPLSVAVLTLAFFLPALQNGFVDWDDEKTILENPYYRGLDWPQLRWMFTTFSMGHYQPLSWVSFGLDYLFWGMSPFGYHLTSLLLHTANALIFYLITLRLLAPALPVSPGKLPIRLAAWFGALLFALHPLRVESVAWISERRDVLSGLFLLLTLLCYLKAVARTDAARRSWMAAAIVLYGLSLLSKAAGMTLPVVLVVLDIYLLGRLGGSAEGWFGPAARRVWWEKVPFLLLAIVCGVVALMAQGAAGALLPLETYGVGGRVAQALFGISFYLWKTIVPLNLSPIYGIPLHLEPADWLLLVLSASVDVGVTAAVVRERRRRPALLAAWTCYLALLAPILGFAQAGPQIAADRYTYLPCLALAALSAGAWLRLFHRPGTAPAIVISAALGGAILSLGLLTWKQAQVWRDSETLWRHAVTAYPRASRGHNNLGNALANQGNAAEAIAHYREALRIDPNFRNAHANIGMTLHELGELPEAIEHYREALRIDPGYKEAHNNLGIALFHAGRIPEAIAHYRAALRIDPGYKEAHNNLGNVLAEQGVYAEAIEQFRQALSIDPGYEQARASLSLLLEAQGKR